MNRSIRMLPFSVAFSLTLSVLIGQPFIVAQKVWAESPITWYGADGGYGEDGGDVLMENVADEGYEIYQHAIGGRGGSGDDLRAPGRGGNAQSSFF